MPPSFFDSPTKGKARLLSHQEYPEDDPPPPSGPRHETTSATEQLRVDLPPPPPLEAQYRHAHGESMLLGAVDYGDLRQEVERARIARATPEDLAKLTARAIGATSRMTYDEWREHLAVDRAPPPRPLSLAQRLEHALPLTPGWLRSGTSSAIVSNMIVAAFDGWSRAQLLGPTELEHLPLTADAGELRRHWPPELGEAIAGFKSPVVVLGFVLGAIAWRDRATPAAPDLRDFLNMQLDLAFHAPVAAAPRVRGAVSPSAEPKK